MDVKRLSRLIIAPLGRGYYLWSLAILWTLLLICSLIWNEQNASSQVYDLVRVQARTAYEKDVLYRFWNSSHGLVYVPISSETPPNPYLKVPERDIVTPSGKPLTLMNPAYMTRQANELGEARMGISGHLTSLMPLRPANAPDEWERKALLEFESGVLELSHVEELGDKQLMRLMRPLLVEEECIECHAEQGYKVGEIRGGISVSIDMAPSLALLQSTLTRLRVGHLLLWVTGLSGLLVRSRMLIKRDRERLQAESRLQQLNCELEDRVTKRTLELKESNRLLEEDIERRIAGEEERDRLAEQLRHSQKMEIIGTLAGGIAHDFNNLLTPILGYSELALQRSAISENVRRDLTQIFNAADRAKGLVRQILAFSHRNESERVAVSLQQIIREVLDLIRPTFPKTIKIEVQLPAGDLCVHADPVQIHQVVMNLCTNAWQAMQGQDGTLLLSLQSVNIKDNELSVPPGDYIRLQVCDSGCGIDEELVEKIFDPFFTTKEVGEGTGLGLSVVQGIIHRHGGVIDVETSKKGCCFRIHLPLISTPETQAAELITIEADGERILLVDDEVEIVEMLSIGLGRYGFKVSSFSSGQQALEAFRQQPDGFDILLSDRIMPEMGGQQLAEAILAIRPDLPVLFMTGYDDASSGLSGQTSAGDICLPKPVTASFVAAQVLKKLSAV